MSTVAMVRRALLVTQAPLLPRQLCRPQPRSFRRIHIPMRRNARAADAQRIFRVNDAAQAALFFVRRKKVGRRGPSLTRKILCATEIRRLTTHARQPTTCSASARSRVGSPRAGSRNRQYPRRGPEEADGTAERDRKPPGCPRLRAIPRGVPARGFAKSPKSASGATKTSRYRRILPPTPRILPPTPRTRAPQLSGPRSRSR